MDVSFATCRGSKPATNGCDSTTALSASGMGASSLRCIAVLPFARQDSCVEPLTANCEAQRLRQAGADVDSTADVASTFATAGFAELRFDQCAPRTDGSANRVNRL